MCGIAGWLGQPRVTAHTVPAVLGALRRRGPDASGIRTFDGAVLIHTRLKIIDLSDAGAQPMPNEDATVWTVFNGEIYNHRELRRELEARGHRFQGHADTEVIPHLYEELGDAFPERLRGMFAIAVLDIRRHRLVLARDRFGVKPLYYAITDDAIAFASELAALTHIPAVDIRPDPQAVHDFVALHVIPAPSTFYRGVRALGPGERLAAEHVNGTISTALSRYHTWAITPDPSLGRAAASARAAELVEVAVARQLESDVPLGSLLSGGIDSSIVSAAAQRALEGALRTFGVTFNDPEFDEGPATASVAAALRTAHEMLPFGTMSASWDDIADILRAPGQPFADTSIFAVDRLCQAVREHVTVALSGDGGDEGFGGYDYYSRVPALATVERLPPSARRLSLLAARAMTRPLATIKVVPRQLPTRLRDLGDTRDGPSLVADVVAWTRPAEMRTLWAGPAVDPVARLFAPQWEHDVGRSPVERLAALLVEADTRVRMANDYLPKVDVASMRHSLEVRVPLLDEDLFGFGLTLPFALRNRSGETKPILRDVARRSVPSVADLPKHGFGVPVDTWVDHAFQARLRDELLGPTSKLGDFLDMTVCRTLVDAFVHRAPPPALTRQGLYQRAFMLLALQLHLGKTPPR